MPKLTRREMITGVDKARVDSAQLDSLLLQAWHETDAVTEDVFSTAFVRYHKELKEQIPKLLEGPASLDDEDLLKWACDNYKAYLILSNDRFTTKNTPYPELYDVRGAALLPMRLMEYFLGYFPENEKYSEKSLDAEMDFTQNARMSGYLEDIKANPEYTAKYNASVTRFLNADKEVTSIDDVINDLDDFRKELKATDPWWIATNSDEFRQLRDSLNSTLAMFQEYKHEPGKMNLSQVKETLKAFGDQAGKYSKRKLEEFKTSKKSRDSQRGDIAGRLSAYVSSSSVTEKLAILTVKDTINHFYGTVVQVHEGKMDYFTKSRGEIMTEVASVVDVYKNLPRSGYETQKNKLALEVASLFKEIGKDEAWKLVKDPAFAAIKEDLQDIASDGAKLIESKRAEAIQNEIKTEIAGPAPLV